MLPWALISLVIALAAGILGFTGIAGPAAIARVLFVICVLAFVMSLIMARDSGSSV